MLKSQKTSAESATGQAQAELKRAQDDLITAGQLVEEYKKNAESFFRLQAISYLRGEELTRISIPGGVTEAETTNIYRSMLRRAKSVATDHGARPDVDNGYFNGSAGPRPSDSVGRYLSDDEVEKYWVSIIRRNRSDEVMIARAAMNHFGSEPISLEITVQPNPIVFRKGEIITESRIDGRTSEIEVLTAIREFLRTFVNTKARNRKMIPVKSRDGESFGEFTQNQLLSAVAKAKAVTRSARLVAVARLDTRAGDPLEIELEVR